MKKVIARAALILLFAWVFEYLAISFVQAELNPFVWEQEVRASLILLMSLSAFVVGVVAAFSQMER